MSDFKMKLQELINSAFTTSPQSSTQAVNTTGFKTSYLTTESSKMEGYKSATNLDFSIENFKNERAKNTKGKFSDLQQFGFICRQKSPPHKANDKLINTFYDSNSMGLDFNAKKFTTILDARSKSKERGNILKDSLFASRESGKTEDGRKPSLSMIIFNKKKETEGGLKAFSSTYSLHNNSFSIKTQSGPRGLSGNSRVKKEIELFSKTLKDTSNKHCTTSYINRPMLSMNKPEMGIISKDYLISSPTNIMKNLLVTSNLVAPSKKHSDTFISLMGIYPKNAKKEKEQYINNASHKTETQRKIESDNSEIEEFSRELQKGKIPQPQESLFEKYSPKKKRPTNPRIKDEK